MNVLIKKGTEMNNGLIGLQSLKTMALITKLGLEHLSACLILILAII